MQQQQCLFCSRPATASADYWYMSYDFLRFQVCTQCRNKPKILERKIKEKLDTI